MPFLKRMVEKYPFDYYFGIIQNAESNASVYDDYWNCSLAGCHLYAEIMTAAKKVEPEVTFGGVIAMLGQNDASDWYRDQYPGVKVAEAFAEGFKAMVEKMRIDLNAPNMPAFIGAYEENAPIIAAGEVDNWKIVRDEILLIPTILPGSGVNNYIALASEFIGRWQLNRAGQLHWSNNLVDRVIVPGADNAWNHFWYPADTPVDPDPEPVNQPPVAVISVPSAVTVGEDVILDATSSHDDHNIASFAWAFGDGGAGTGPTVSHTWPVLGTYVVGLTVTDNTGLTGQAATEVHVVASTKPTITILEPTAGERLLVGSTRPIVWETEFLDDVKIMLSADDGETWTIIGYCDTSGECWGELEWTVPDLPSDRCRISIEGYNRETRTISQPFAIERPGDRIVGGCSNTGLGARRFALGPLLLLLGLFGWRRRRSAQAPKPSPQHQPDCPANPNSPTSRSS